MAWPPTVSDFKAQFFREFVYGDGPDKIMDLDIQRALAETPTLFNANLLDTVALQTIGFLYVAAHLLWENIDMAGGLSAINTGRGLRGDAEGVTASKSVGQASVNYVEPPARIKESPTLARLWRSKFGAKYVEMIAVRLIGNMVVVDGPNQAISFSNE